MASLVLLHDQLRSILNDLVFTFDTTQKEKLLKKSVDLLDSYLSSADSRKPQPSAKSNKENIPVRKTVSQKRPPPEKMKTGGKKGESSQQKSLKDVKKKFIGYNVTPAQKKKEKHFQSQQSQASLASVGSGTSRQDPFLDSAVQDMPCSLSIQPNQQSHKPPHRNPEYNSAKEEHLNFNITQQSSEQSETEIYKQLHLSTKNESDFFEKLKVKGLSQHFDSQEEGSSLQKQVGLFHKRALADPVKVLSKEPVLKKILGFLDEKDVESVQLTSKTLGREFVRLRLSVNKEMMQSVGGFELEVSLEKIAKEVALKTFESECASQIQQLLQESLSENQLQQVTSNAALHQMVILLYILLNRMKQLKINPQTKEIVLQDHSLIRQPLGLILQSILAEFQCTTKQLQVVHMFFPGQVLEAVKKSVYMSRKISPVVLFMHKLVTKVLVHFQQRESMTALAQRQQSRLERIARVLE